MTLKHQVLVRVGRYHRPFTLHQVAHGFEVPLHRIVDILGVMVRSGQLQRIKAGVFAPLDWHEGQTEPPPDPRSARERAWQEFRESLHTVVPDIEVNTCSRNGD